MKKLLLLAGLLLGLGLTFSSCKTRENCPAYSQAPSGSLEQGSF
jgi:hypothetical protein